MLLDILEEHAEEAGFLYSLRQFAVESLGWDAEGVRGVDARLAAHLDGLLVGAGQAWQLCQPLLTSESEDEAFIGAMLALANGADAELRDALPDAREDTLNGICRALCLSSHPRVAGRLSALLDDDCEAIGAIALEALAFRRTAAGPFLERALLGESPALQRAGLIYAGRLRQRAALERASALVDADDARLGSAALETILLLDANAARARARALLGDESPLAARAAHVLGIAGHAEDRELLQRAVEKADTSVARSALLALANLGAPEAVPFLIDLLSDPERAPLAGVALRRVLGPDAPFEPIEKPAPPPRLDDDDLPDEGAVEEDDLPVEAVLAELEEDDTVWTPDSELPCYAAEPLSRWWKAGQARMMTGSRYRAGAVFVPDAPRDGSPMLFRHDEALEIALNSPDRPLLETRASAVRLGADPDA